MPHSHSQSHRKLPFLFCSVFRKTVSLPNRFPHKSSAPMFVFPFCKNPLESGSVFSHDLTNTCTSTTNSSTLLNQYYHYFFKASTLSSHFFSMKFTILAVFITLFVSFFMKIGYKVTNLCICYKFMIHIYNITSRTES